MATHFQKVLPVLHPKSPFLPSRLFPPPTSHFQISRQNAASVRPSVEQEEENARPFQDVPGIKKYPLVGSLLGVVTRKDFDVKKIHVMWQNIMKEYGPICKVELPFAPTMVAVTDPGDIEKMYRVTMDNPIRDAFHSLRKVRYDTVDNYFEKKGGLLSENHEEWWRVRSKVQTPMMRPKNLIQYLTQMDQVALEFMDKISDFQKVHGEMPSDFQGELYKWALESVAIVALNRRFGCFDPNLAPDSDQMKILNAVNTLFESLNTTEMNIQWWKLFPTKSYKDLINSHELFLRVVDKNVQEAVSEINAKSSQTEEEEGEATLLKTLLRVEGLTSKDVITIILDMFFAGIDTTAHTLGFSLYLLSRNQGAKRRLQEEVDSVLGDGRGPITESHLARLSFLKNCIRESLRIFPIVIGNTRLLEEDTVLSGYHIPKGCQIFAISAVTSKDETLFPRPYEFLPERWGRDKPLGPIHPFAFLPFSYGTRMCIGRRIAEQEMYTFLARAMHRFNVDYKYDDMDMATRLVSVPSLPLRFQFTERK